MASPVEDPSSLQDKKLVDQVGNEIGKICAVYEQEGDPMWVAVKSDTGMASDRLVFIPLARIKEEEGELRVPYSEQHLNDSPEVESKDELSEDDERALRAYYSVSIGDGELRTDNESYAAQVPDSGELSKKADSSDGGDAGAGDHEGSGDASEKEGRQESEDRGEEGSRQESEDGGEEGSRQESDEPDTKASSRDDSDEASTEDSRQKSDEGGAESESSGDS